MKLLLAAALLLTVQLADASDLYRWVDKDGKAHYGDVPPEDAEQLKFGEPETAAASGVQGDVSYEARAAAQHFPLTLYVTENCGDSCKQARDYLRKRRLPFAENILKTPEEFASFQNKSGTDSIPTLSIGNSWLKGFQQQQWQNELDSVGYPKSK